MRSFALLCVTVALSTVTTHTAQSQAPEPRPGLVLTAVIVDTAGEPIADLASTDFAVTVDGTPRALRFAQFVTHAVGQPSTPPRTIILLIDRANLRAGSGGPTLNAASAFLDRLAPTDGVGLVALPSGGPAIDVTTDRARVKDALGKVSGQVRPAPNTMSHSFGLVEALYFLERDPRWNLVVTRECIERYLPGYLVSHCSTGIEQDAENLVLYVKEAGANAVNVMQRVLLWLSFLDGPKALVLVTDGLVTGSPQSPNSLVDTEPLRKAAAAGGAGVYLLYQQGGMPEMRRSPTAQEDEGLRRSGLDVVAERTGGIVIPITSGGDAAFARVAREMSGHYVLGLEPLPVDREGVLSNVEVKVRREGAVVRAHSSRMRAAAVGTQ